MAAIRTIEDVRELDELLAQSRLQAVWIFKHSLTCPISSRAWSEFCRFAETKPDAGVFAVIEVQNARPVSDALAERTGVRHQSPQAILLRNAAAAWHASHSSVHFAALEKVAS
jgi:monothiol bacilliredoxin